MSKITETRKQLVFAFLGLVALSLLSVNIAVFVDVPTAGITVLSSSLGTVIGFAAGQIGNLIGQNRDNDKSPD